MKKSVLFISTLLLSVLFLFTITIAESSAADRSIAITNEDYTVSVGRQLRLSIEVTRLTDDAPQRSTLECSSSDETIAKVTPQGAVTGVAPGQAEITCCLKDNPEIKATVTVNVIQPVKQIKLESNKITLLLGGPAEASRGKIGLSILPDDATSKSCTFTSSDEAVVTVDNEGNLQALAAGKARITIVPNEPGTKVSVFCDVTVGNAVTKIAIPSSQTIEKKRTFSLKPTIEPVDAINRNVEYSSSNPAVATVAKNGVISALKCGTTTITCTATDGSGVSASCAVTVIQPVTKVSSNDRKFVIFKGKTRTWYPKVEPADATNRKLSFSSDSSWIASVDSSGTITGKGSGKTRVTAKSTDGSNRTVSVEVIVEPSVPISLDSIGHGIYNYNLLAVTVTNKCSTLTIVDFDFDMKFYDYGNSLINGGSYSLGSQERIPPGKQKTIKRTVYGSGQAYKTVMTITGVLFSDGTYWSIPSGEQETWSFTRR